MKRALMQIDGGMLAELLKLPKGITVINAFSELRYANTLALVLEGETLPVAQAKYGQLLPQLTPLHGSTNRCSKCCIAQPFFLRWEGEIDNGE